MCILSGVSKCTEGIDVYFVKESVSARRDRCVFCQESVSARRG